jgi:ribosomal protein S27AE
MPLTEAQLDALLAHVNRTWSTKECSRCGANEWVPRELTGFWTRDLPPEPGRSLRPATMVALVCGRCAHAVLVFPELAGNPDPPAE